MSTESDFEMDDSERMPLTHDRRVSHNRRKLIRFIPDVSAGTVIQSLTFLLFLGAGYGTYTSDRTEMRKDIEANKTLADAKIQVVSQGMAELKSDTRETRTAVQGMAEKLSDVNAQLKVIQANQQGQKK